MTVPITNVETHIEVAGYIEKYDTLMEIAYMSTLREVFEG